MNGDKSNDDKGHAYVLQARDEQQQYSVALLRENEKLRATVATLESDHRRAEEQVRTAVEELSRLRSRFHEVAEENQRYAEQYQQIETHSSNLANLYVASYQLHASVDRDVVLNTILEIVINLIGSEQVAIYERNGGAELRVASSFGVDEDRLASFLPLAAGAADADPNVTAHIPLKVGDDSIGAILIFSLLEHKPALEPVDHELFELLAVHASTALYCASLHAKSSAVPA